MTSNHLMIKGHCLQSQQKTNIIDSVTSVTVCSLKNTLPNSKEFHYQFLYLRGK